MIEVEVVEFSRETNKPLDIKKMLLTEWNEMSKKKYAKRYYKAYQIGYSQFFNK
jgi:hypothetical protein